MQWRSQPQHEAPHKGRGEIADVVRLPENASIDPLGRKPSGRQTFQIAANSGS